MSQKQIVDLLRKGDYEAAITSILNLSDPVTDSKYCSPTQTYMRMRQYATRKQESMFLITLNGAHEQLKIHELTRGLVNKTMIHPREVFRTAIEDNAVAIMLVHNHPSNNPEPSPEDRDVTTRMCQVGNLVGIPLLDHIVITRNEYYSFLEKGELA